MKYNLKATKGSFGEYGRVTRGTILRNLTEDRAKKLIAGGAYALATDEEVKAADETKVIDGLAPAKRAKTASPDLSKMKIAQLKAFAKGKGVDLGDAKKRDEIVTAITMALASTDNGDTLADLSDDELKKLAAEKGIEIEGDFERDDTIAAIQLAQEAAS